MVALLVYYCFLCFGWVGFYDLIIALATVFVIYVSVCG